MDEWFHSSQGIRAAKAFSEELLTFKDQLRGHRLLQLGHCGDNIWLPSLNYQHKLIVSPCVEHDSTSVIALVNQLPFDRDSVDCIIAPFTYEAFSLEKNPIDELDRILKPMGYLVFWGINPISFWGLGLKSRRLSIFGDSPSALTSVLSVKYDLLNRGFKQCVFSTFYYIPPVRNEKMIHHFEFLNEMGKMLWLYPAGFYCLIVQKHEIIGPSFQFAEQVEVKERYVSCPDNSLA